MASLINNNGSYALVFSKERKKKKISLRLRFSPENKKAAIILQKKYESEFALGLFDPFEKKTVKFAPVKITEASEAFLKAAQIENTSKTTYQGIIRRFRKHSNIIYTDKITTDKIRAWLDQPTVAPVSKQTYLRHLSTFLKWCVEQGYLKENPAEGLKLKKFEQPVHPYMTDIEVRKLVDFIKNYVAENKHLYHEINGGHWLWQAVWFAFLTGCRKKEIVNLKWTDFGPGNKHLIIRETKGKRARFIPIHHELQILLDSIPRIGDYVFSASGVRLVPDKFYKYYKAMVIRAGLDPKLRLHDLRHSFGYNATAKGAGLRFIQDTLGHKDISTTLRYTQTALKDNEKIMDSLYLVDIPNQ